MKSFFSKQNIRRLKVLVTTERALIIVLIGCIFYLILGYIPNNYNENRTLSNSQYSYLNPSIGFLGKDNMIVDFQSLRVSLTSTYEKRDDYLVSIYFEYLPTGANISINKDEQIWPASLIKIPVAMAAMKKVQDKKWKLDNELVILDDDKDNSYGDLYKLPTGTTLTIQKLLEESLINSDNTAHFVLLRNLESEELEDVYVHLGLDDVIDALKKSPNKEVQEDNRITAKRYTIFFRSLYNGTFLDREFSQLFLKILQNAPKELLSRGLPEDIIFVHKTGVRLDEAVRADAGIVYVPGRPYLITVMVQKKGNGDLNEAEVDMLFKEISDQIYRYVKNAR